MPQASDRLPLERHSFESPANNRSDALRRRTGKRPDNCAAAFLYLRTLLPDFALLTVKNHLFRLLCFLLLLAGLESCAVYNRIFHPYCIPTPPMSAEYKAKLKEDKAKKKNAAAGAKEAAKKKKEAAPEGSTDASTPTDFASDDAAAKTPDETVKKQPSGAKVKYNSQGLMKKSKLGRPKPLHTVSKPSAWQRFKNIFRKRGSKKRKSEPNPTPTDESNPTQSPAPDSGP